MSTYTTLSIAAVVAVVAWALLTLTVLALVVAGLRAAIRDARRVIEEDARARAEWERVGKEREK